MGEWRMNDTVFTLSKNNNNLLMVSKRANEVERLLLEKTKGNFSLPSYTVAGNLGDDKKTTFTVNIRNRLVVRENGVLLGFGQPIAAYPALLDEFTSQHSKPEFGVIKNKKTEIKKEIDEMSKKQIFEELVKLEDSGISQEKSKSIIAEKYQITRSELLDILQEGIEKDWLSELDRT
tara:strand:- start:414 stop:944 length:531 start_codon:yes stop_codon:yes gene_type:complete